MALQTKQFRIAEKGCTSSGKGAHPPVATAPIPDKQCINIYMCVCARMYILRIMHEYVFVFMLDTVFVLFAHYSHKRKGADSAACPSVWTGIRPFALPMWTGVSLF